eukprot:1484230-Lingulodinium_polyedra.AAC.1
MVNLVSWPPSAPRAPSGPTGSSLGCCGPLVLCPAARRARPRPFARPASLARGRRRRPGRR